MENSKKIQIGLLALVAVLLIANFTGAFDGLFGGKDDVRNEARESLDVSGNNTLSPTGDVASAAKPAEPAAPTGPTTTIEWSETEYDYGTVDQGEKVNHNYKFTNTGSEPLIISNAKGSCGCTVPSWPKDPIPPGGTGEIQVQFDSKGKKGVQSKRVTITANTDPVQSFLTIKGEVAAPEGAATPAQPAAPAQ